MMNKASLLVVLFLFLFSAVQNNVYAQCGDPFPTWSKKYQNNDTIRWYYNTSSVSGATIYNNGVYQTTSTAKNAVVVAAINWAMSQWDNELNYANINFERTYSTSNDDIYISFESWSDSDGSFSNGELNLSDNTIWVNQPSTPSDAEVDIYAVVLHEMGHAILGGGHTDYSYESETSVMTVGEAVRNFTTCDSERIEELYDPIKTVTVKNSFGYGQMYVDNSLISITSSTGKTYSSWQESSFPHTLRGKTNQTSDDYIQVFDEWQKEVNGVTSLHNSDIETSIYAIDATYTANFLNQYNVTFRNEFSGGTIKVNDATYNSPTSTFHVLDDRYIEGQALYQVINGIEYTFDQWDNGSTDNPETFSISNGHKDIVAEYNGRPENSYRELNFNTGDPVGSPIEVSWKQHPNSNVSEYRIYRKTKFGAETLISTVNRTSASSYTYTDRLYSITKNVGANNLLKYDVRAYYSTEGTVSDYDWLSVFGEILFKQNEEDLEERVNLDVLEYAMSNYPNPFNPTTTIHYQLPEDTNVSIKVFDILGKQIVELVNGEKGTGKHNIMFNSSNLSAGLYIYTIEAKPINLNGKGFSQTNKMLLVK